MGFSAFLIFPRKLCSLFTWGFRLFSFSHVRFSSFLHRVFGFSHFTHVNIRMDPHLDICTCATSYASDGKPCEASALNELRSNEFSTATPEPERERVCKMMQYDRSASFKLVCTQIYKHKERIHNLKKSYPSFSSNNFCAKASASSI